MSPQKRTRSKLASRVDNTKLPTIDKVSALPEVEKLVIEDETQGDEEISPGDAIYVVPPGFENEPRPLPPHVYWKMNVESIHQEGAKRWVIGTWYYNRSQLEAQLKEQKSKITLPPMGLGELISSDHQDVVDPQSIECLTAVDYFNDESPHSDIADAWYYRLSVELKGLAANLTGLNGHCICVQWYSPELDVQRFCYDCDKWFHIKCLTDPQPSEGETVPLQEKIANMPVVRGALGKVNDEWRVAGSGRKIQRVKIWKEAGVFPEDWAKELGDSFITYVKRTTFSFYACATKDCTRRI
ncbi:hypothetical protein M413DRAFT_30978 [Hebeloma cylindrosporum]|uniref:BAH domain-containing protein n=1 Tax=Hebeloma cylindrosporum TaxID=76867 RepID=A0A0C2XHA3_HEBCY|nr:hypothetical protein M413DRAFT_30978 [Hebeloma cylindrosporum h7]